MGLGVLDCRDVVSFVVGLAGGEGGWVGGGFVDCYLGSGCDRFCCCWA